MKIIRETLKNYQQGIILAIGYLLVALIAFVSGRAYAGQIRGPEVRVEEAFSVPTNDTQNNAPAQSAENPSLSGIFMPIEGDCQGKIKGNIGSGDSRVYHLPSGSFYKRVAPELCFMDEAAATAAGFKKSAK